MAPEERRIYMNRKRRRRATMMGGSSSSPSSSLTTLSTISKFITTTTTLLSSSLLIHQAHAGLTFGGVTSTDSCYKAMQNAHIENTIDKDGYAFLINELSNNAFTSFRYDEASDSWGYFPVISFNDLPSSIRGEFYTHACGGPYIVCDNAYLYSDGTGDSDSDETTPSAQQEIYLYQVCKGMEDAIDAEVALLPPTPPPVGTPKPSGYQFPTYPPTVAPLPMVKPVLQPSSSPSSSPMASINGEMTIQLVYNAAVTDTITVEELNNNNPNSLVREQLLATMTAWSSVTSDTYNAQQQQPITERQQQLQNNNNRELVVTPIPLVSTGEGGQQDPNIMAVYDVECTISEIAVPLQSTDHCIQIQTNLTLSYENELPDAQDNIRAFFENKFQTDIENNVLWNSIVPESTRNEFKTLYVASDIVTAPPNNPSPTPPPNYDNLIKGWEEEEEGKNNEGGGSGNVAGIAAGVSVGIVAVIVGLFVYRRRRYHHDDWSSKSSYSSAEQKEFNPSRDLEGGDLSGRSGSRGSRSSGYSRSSRSYSGSSGSSSASMQSYSGSDKSSHSSGSSRSRSSGSYGSRSKSDAGSYTSGSYTSGPDGGPASVSASESDATSISSVGEVVPPAVAQRKDDETSTLESIQLSGAESTQESVSTRERKDDETSTLESMQLSGAESTQESVSTRGSRSSASASSASRSTAYSSTHGSASQQSEASSEGYLANVDLLDQSADAKLKSSNSSRSSSRLSAEGTPISMDDSSAGSSGWDSSDGDSSEDSASYPSDNESYISTSDQGADDLDDDDDDDSGLQEKSVGSLNTLKDGLQEKSVGSLNTIKETLVTPTTTHTERALTSVVPIRTHTKKHLSSVFPGTTYTESALPSVVPTGTHTKKHLASVTPTNTHARALASSKHHDISTLGGGNTSSVYDVELGGEVHRAPPGPAKTISRCRRFTGYGFIALVMAGCCVLYAMGTFERFLEIFYITGYGILAITYYFMTTIFALLNRRKVNKRSKELSRSGVTNKASVSVNVVGYREDPEYFRSCLSSVKDLSYSNIVSVNIVIDGNDSDDTYMMDIAKDVFGHRATCMNLTEIPSQTSQHVIPAQCSISSKEAPVYIITQPHCGKREAIYTAYLLGKKVNAEFMLNTDSDTILKEDALDELVYMTIDRPEVNAVAGQLTIFNKTNWLSYLTASRYFVAFNVERGAQSYHGVVGCISGPLGLYRMSAIGGIIDEWVNQHFMGTKCTFGDDRHMTNKILSMEGKVVYTHRALGATETPTTFTRFIAQQTRWSKSYWRELILQAGWATRHWYLLLETVYGMLFPVLIATTLLIVVFSRTWWSHTAIMAVTFAMPLLRCLVVFLFFGYKWLVLLGVFYPIMYFTSLLPVKFVAFFTMAQNNWGTSSRKKIVNSWAPVVPVFIWLTVIFFGLLKHGLKW